MNDNKIDADSLPPEPEVTGVAGNQTAVPPAESEALVKAYAPLEPGAGLGELSVTAVLEQVDGVRGGGMRLLLAHTWRLETDLANTRRELERLRKEREEWKDKFGEAKQNNAVLSQGLRHAKDIQRLKGLLITLGAVVAGVNNPQVFNMWNAFGLLLLLLGWFWPNPKEN